MPLLDHPRLSKTDRDWWAIQSAADRDFCRTAFRRAAEATAIGRIRGFLAKNPKAHVSVSWGKDSVTALHLARKADPGILAIHVTHPWLANPCAAAVRDAFLSEWPVPYIEHEITDESRFFAGMDEKYGEKRIEGIRAAESRVRRISAYVHGVDTGNVCRPLLDWSHRDVFLYHEAHSLPLGSVYAMSMDGSVSRERLRMDHLRGPDWEMEDACGTMEAIAWERRYFPEMWDVDREGRATKRADVSIYAQPDALDPSSHPG
jgi:phosphoadenosine phosphosulfate reductase